MVLKLILGGSQYRSRLDVIRAILGDANNFAHSALKRQPIETDLQVLHLLKTRIKLSQAAAAEFRAAKRDDLSDKEESQIAVLQEYISLVPVASEEEIKRLATEIIERKIHEQALLSSASVIKELLGTLAGKQVDMAFVARTTRDMLLEASNPTEIPTETVDSAI